MYLNAQEEKRVRELQNDIENVQREIRHLESELEKFKYTTIRSNDVYHGGASAAQDIKNKLDAAKAKKRRLEDNLDSVYRAIGEDRRKINQEDLKKAKSSQDRKERLQEFNEKKELFNSASKRWKNASFFYKLTHFTKRPNKINENLSSLSKEEIKGLYR